MEKLSITLQTKKDLQAELDNLLHVERPNVIQEISAAREQGDLSENAEFDAAREKQAYIEARIREIQNLLENHVIISANKNQEKSTVTLGTKVDIKNLKTNKDESFEIIGSIGVDPFTSPKKISNDSPIGRALMDKQVGDITTIKEVASPYKIKILKIY